VTPPRESRLATIAVEGAARRVRADLARDAASPTRLPPWAVLLAALVLFLGGFALRLSVDDPGALVANFYTVPIAMLAVVYGVRAGLVAAGFALVLVWAWGRFESQHVGVLGYSTRGAVFLLVATLVGYYSERLRRDIAERRRAERELAIRAEDLSVSNTELTRAVTRLEAFAEIARAVGGETELETVLDRILDHGRAIVEARRLVAYLEQDGRIVAAAATDRLPPPANVTDSLLERVLAGGAPARIPPRNRYERAAIVVPLRWQGASMGALVAVEPLEGEEFDADAEELMAAVATSAAAAVATAKSVAADRLRHTIDASEEARSRWARELHDETLQALVGLRMLLASSRRHGSPERLEEVTSQALDQIRDEILNLRRLIAELRPAALDELGLGAAIETLSERTASATGLEVSTRVEMRDDGAPRLARETETTVYRLVQEALTNAARHSGAALVRVDVAERNGLIEVTVADDGRGFDPAAAASGFGLRGMRERAQLAGGSLTIEASAGGSTVRARVPAGRAPRG
jgi:signal transduction histidine kinase